MNLLPYRFSYIVTKLTFVLLHKAIKFSNYSSNLNLVWLIILSPVLCINSARYISDLVNIDKFELSVMGHYSHNSISFDRKSIESRLNETDTTF